jgi:hypothetical protein
MEEGKLTLTRTNYKANLYDLKIFKLLFLVDSRGAILQAGRSWVRDPMRSLHFSNSYDPSSHTMALG